MFRGFHMMHETILSSISEPRTYYNPEWAKTIRKQPTPDKMIQKLCKMAQSSLKFQNWGNLEYLLAFNFKFWGQIPRIGRFAPKSIKFLILTEFFLCPERCWLQICHFSPKNVDPKSSNLGILGLKVLTF